MIRINLLPFRSARKKENVRRQVSLFLLSVFLLALGLFWYHISLGSKISDMDRKVADTKTELASLEKQLEEIKQIRAMLDTIQRKTAVIEDLELARQASARLLDAMSQLLVKDQMYLTQFKITGNQVDLTGIAADNQTIADFMTRLESSGLFNKVDLKSTSAISDKSNRRLQNFSISSERKPLQRATRPDQTPNKAGKK